MFMSKVKNKKSCRVTCFYFTIMHKQQTNTPIVYFQFDRAISQEFKQFKLLNSSNDQIKVTETPLLIGFLDENNN